MVEKLLFAVYGRKKYITLDKLNRYGVDVPAGFIFDGVSVPWVVYVFVELYQILKGWK